MANITMDSLKKEAVQVYTGMLVVFPQHLQSEALNISGLVPKFNGCSIIFIVMLLYIKMFLNYLHYNIFYVNCQNGTN